MLFIHRKRENYSRCMCGELPPRTHSGMVKYRKIHMEHEQQRKVQIEWLQILFFI